MTEDDWRKAYETAYAAANDGRECKVTHAAGGWYTVETEQKSGVKYRRDQILDMTQRLIDRVAKRARATA